MTKTRSFIQTTMKNLFASIPLSLFLIVIYGLAIGWATFIEKDYGTLVANDVIYHSWWFEVLNVWLLLNILGCMYKSAKISFKISVQIFHLALVMIIIGAAITRYYGFEGNMVLKNGIRAGLNLQLNPNYGQAGKFGTISTSDTIDMRKKWRFFNVI